MLVKEGGCLDEGTSHVTEQMSTLYGSTDPHAILASSTCKGNCMCCNTKRTAANMY